MDKGRIYDHAACEKHIKFLHDQVTKQEYDDHITAILKHYQKSTYEELKKFLQYRNRTDKATKSQDIKNDKDNDADINMQDGNALACIGANTISLLSQVLQYIDPNSSNVNCVTAQQGDQNSFDKTSIDRRQRMEKFLLTSDFNLKDNNVELYQSAMGSLRLMYKMALTNTPIYRFAEWAETIGDFGGYCIKDHTSQTSATEWLLTLGKAQKMLDDDDIKNAKTLFATIDAQSSSTDSWTGLLSHIRDKNGMKKIIFTYGEYLVEKTAIEKENEKYFLQNVDSFGQSRPKRKQKRSRFQLAHKNETGNDIAMTNDEDVDIVSNGNNDNCNENKNDDESSIKPSKKLQLLFEYIYNQIGVNWKILNGECSDGGSKEKAGMTLVCTLYCRDI